VQKRQALNCCINSPSHRKWNFLMATILIVDTNPSDRRYITCSVIMVMLPEANDGVEALEPGAEGTPDPVMDILMPHGRIYSARARRRALWQPHRLFSRPIMNQKYAGWHKPVEFGFILSSL
jgi:hypothetical protein